MIGAEIDDAHHFRRYKVGQCKNELHCGQSGIYRLCLCRSDRVICQDMQNSVWASRSSDKTD